MAVLAYASTLLLLAGSANALALASMQPNAALQMNNEKCKDLCQRQLMKDMAPEFKQIVDPTACSEKCDQVYDPMFNIRRRGSFLQSASASALDSARPREPVAVRMLASRASTQPRESHPMNNGDCRGLCQRGAMKDMGPDFNQIDDPAVCSNKCDQVYENMYRVHKQVSFLQIASMQPSAGRLNNADCKGMCERGAMKDMGPDFNQIEDPAVCSNKCDQVYENLSRVHKQVSFLQIASMQPSGSLNNAECKDLCGRGAMKDMGPDFNQIEDSAVCSNKCDQVYENLSRVHKQVSFLQIANAFAHDSVEPMNNADCRSLCHRGLMKDMGPDFVQIADPALCSNKCDDVFENMSSAHKDGSFLQAAPKVMAAFMQKAPLSTAQAVAEDEKTGTAEDRHGKELVKLGESVELAEKDDKKMSEEEKRGKPSPVKKAERNMKAERNLKAEEEDEKIETGEKKLSLL